MDPAAPVVLDVTRLIRRLSAGRLPTGVDRVSLAYVAHYARRARALVRHGPRSSLFSEAVSGRIFELLQHRPPGRRAGLLWQTLQGVASGLRSGDAKDLFMFNTGHSGIEHAGIGHMVRRRRVRAVFMVHDLIPLRHPEFCRPGDPERHAARITHMLRLGTGLIANSQATLEDLRRFAEAERLPVPPVIVAPLAPWQARVQPGPADAPVPDARPLFVVLGTVEPRKNHAMLLDLWEQFVARLGEAAPQLVIVGQVGWESELLEKRLARDGPLRGHVSRLRRCGDAELAALLHRATALLFPSFAEGYGLPVAEALAAGVPVIASDLPVLREVGGCVPEYLDPRDKPAWAERVLEYARPGSAAHAAQLERMREFTPSTWARHFEIVDEFLGRLDAHAS